MEKVLDSLEALQAEAATFSTTLIPHPQHATLITLSGELGAGKTSFVQGLALALGIDESVTSPTFVLEKVYELSPSQGRGFARLIHIDAYRLEGEHSLTPLTFAELYTDPANLIVLEWPEIVASQLPPPEKALSFSVLPTNTRSLTYA